MIRKADLSPPGAHSNLLWYAALALFCVGVVAAYWPVFSNDLVWDDRPNILENQHIRSFETSNLAWAWTSTHVGHYQPLTWLSLSLDYSIWKLNPVGYHLTGLALHLVNIILFYFVALGILRFVWRDSDSSERLSRFGAVLASAFFGMHPMRVESVAWATERRDVLCGVFFLVTLLCYLKAVRTGRSGRLHPLWFWLSIVAFALSLLSKALGMPLPAVLLVLDFYPLRRWRGVADHDGATVGRLVTEKIPYLVLTIAIGVVSLLAQSEGRALATWETHGLVERVAQSAYGVVFYLYSAAGLNWYPLYEVVFPINPFETRYILSAVVAIALTVAFIAAWRFFPGGLAAWVCYVALLGPVLGVAQSGSQLVADRYTYLAFLGWAILGGWAVAAVWNSVPRSDWRRWSCIVVPAVAVAIWGSLTWRQIHFWHDEQTLWEHVLKNGPSPHAHNNLGTLADRRGESVAALEHFTSSLALAPRSTLTRQNLIHSMIGHYQEVDLISLDLASEALRRSLSIVAPDEPQAWYALGLATFRRNNAARAVSDFSRAVELKPDVELFWTKLGLAQYVSGDREHAITAFQKAIELDPNSVESWLSMAVALLESGRFAEAADAFRRVVVLAPMNDFAWTGLGACLLQQGQPEAAHAALLTALQINPSNSRAQELLRRMNSTHP